MFLIINCKNKKSPISLEVVSSTSKDSINLKTVKITSFKKTNDYLSSLKDTAICGNWNLTKEQLKEVLALSKKINNSEWDYSYDHLPCEYSGKLTFQNKSYPFDINGGSWLNIYINDSIYRFGCFDSPCEKYFLSKPLNSEIDEK